MFKKVRNLMLVAAAMFAVLVTSVSAVAGTWTAVVQENSTLAPAYPMSVPVRAGQDFAAIAATHGHPNSTRKTIGTYCENPYDVNGNIVVQYHLSYLVSWESSGGIIPTRGVMRFYRQTCQ